MEGNRFFSLLSGLLIGAISGFLIYGCIGNFLACGPYPSNQLFVDMAVKYELYTKALRFGVIPCLIIGLFGGLFLPFTFPRGHFTKSIVAPLFLIVASLAWITYRHNLALMSAGRIALTGLVTFVILIIVLPLAEHCIGGLERIRYLGE